MNLKLPLVILWLCAGTLSAQANVDICEITDSFSYHPGQFKEASFRLPCTWLKKNNKLNKHGTSQAALQKFTCRNDFASHPSYKEEGYVYCGTAIVPPQETLTQEMKLSIGAFARHGLPAKSGFGCKIDNQYMIDQYNNIRSVKNYEIHMDDAIICEL